jgi:hypothetical protein
MIKNIHDHRNRWRRQVWVLTAFFVYLISSNVLCSKPKVTVPDLTPSSIAQLHSFSKNNPGPFTIEVVPQQKWMEAMAGFVIAPFTALRNALSLKNVSLTILSGALSLGWVSYLLCTYLIYKTYRLLKNVHSWVNWCSDDDLLSDYEALYRKINHHKRARNATKNPSLMLITLQQEKELIASYLRLDSFLKAHHLRHYFPHAEKATHKQIERAYAKLQKAQELLTVRNKHQEK